MQLAQLMDATRRGTGAHHVVFGNGFSTRQGCWLPLAPAVPDAWQAVHFDYVGTSPSSHAAWDAERYTTLEAHADDLVGLLTALDVRPVVFVGHSMSGMIGLLASLRAPDLFHSLVLIGASPCYRELPGYHGGFSDATVATLLAEADADLASWMAGFARHALGTTGTPLQLRDFLASLGAMRPDTGRAFLRAMMQSDLRAMLTQVTHPVTIIQAREDFAVPLGVAEYLAAHTPCRAMHILDVDGHLPHVTHPELLAPVLRDTLDWAAQHMAVA
ncbi:MAG: alpha/beta hydrolase [Gemmatimonadetes bacterium]|nr:alpha/beta hydrolase [Gemmatimonadota bacterium]